MTDELSLLTTSDGSVTFFSKEFQEAFHSHHGAKQESEAKFVSPSQILRKANQKSTLRILDVCYGLGYNSAAALESLIDKGINLEIIALESNIRVPQTAVAENLLSIWSSHVREILTTIADTQTYQSDRHAIKLLIGDARQTIQSVPASWADAIFLDPFSPPRCPQLWTVEFMQLLAQRLQPDGYLVTYSCAAAVRAAMSLASLAFGSTTPVGRRSPGTIATLSTNPARSQYIPILSIAEQEALHTRAAIPYHDSNLSDSAEVILSRRLQEQNESKLESTSQWKKRHKFS